jgi:WD40 repeat protein
VAALLLFGGGIAWLCWNIASHAPLTFSVHSGAVLSVAVSPDGRRGLSSGEDGSLCLWDVATGKVARRLVGHRGQVLRVGFTADGQHAFSLDNNWDLRRWDLETGANTVIFPEHKGKLLMWPAGSRALLAGGSPEHTWEAYDVVEDKPLPPDKGTALGPSYSVNLSADGRLALICFQSQGTRTQSLGAGGRVIDDTATVKQFAATVVWDLAAGREVHRFKVPGREIVELITAPDGRRALAREVVLGYRGLVVYGDTEERFETCPEMRLFDLETGEELGLWKGHKEGVRSVAFTPDGQHVLSGSTDGQVLLRDAATGKVCQTLSVASPVKCLTVMPDGQWAVIGDKEGRVTVQHLSR